MYLKSLVLKGFKSFADRSVLSFNPGITAIVGPNGSGKSNISDAVLWVLGERNAKNLRGQAMEDVIFAGSSARRAAGLAEVELVLDNSDHKLPVDFDEVSIMRRMYRSGESEYFINGTAARRIDILDILHDSGLGTGTHSIISQGSLDSILQSKPEDRRALIEEAAGVLKHKQRLARSERKLEAMDQHVVRVRDVVNEVSRQLAPLERRAKRALTYQGLAEEFASLKLKLAVDDLKGLQRAWNEQVSSEEALLEQVNAGKLTIDEAEARVEELTEEIRRSGIDAGELSRLNQRVYAVIERIDSTALLIRERRRAALTRAGEIRLSLDGMQAQRAHIDAQLADAAASLCEVRSSREASSAHVEELKGAQAGLQEQRADFERELADLEQKTSDLRKSLEDAQRASAQARETLSNSMAHLKVIEGHEAELNLQLSRAASDAALAADEASAADEALSALAEQESAARKLVEACTQAREATRAALDEARDNESGLSAQIQALEEVDRANTLAAGSAWAWVAEHADDLKGAIEPLSQVIRPHEGREALVEALLGADVSMLLIDDASCAYEVARALADSENEGEVSLILRQDDAPVVAKAKAYFADASGSASGASGAPDATGVPGRSGVKGAPLIDEIDYPDEAARVVEALLGDVVVCDTLEDALRAHASDTFGLRFAAEDGSVVWASGKVTLGRAIVSDNEGVLARTRHIEQLKSDLTAAREATKSARVLAEQAQDSLSEAQKTSLDLGQKLASLRGEAEAALMQANRTEETLSALRREMENVQAQRDEAQTARDEAQPNIDTYEQQIGEIESELETTRARQDELTSALTPLREQDERIAEELTSAQLELTKLVERETYLTQMHETHLHDLDQMATQSEQSSVTLAQKNASAERLAGLLEVFDALEASARGRLDDLESETLAAEDSSSGLHAQASEARARARAAQEELDALNERLTAARIEKGRLELQVQTALNVITDDCNTSLEYALTLPDLEDRQTCEEEAAHLERRIANLGTINPDAAEEYDELKKRYDYLSAQLADLDTARKALAQINHVIDERMREDFARTFSEVDASFQEIFSTLFPGGTAKLELVDPDDIENTGIEVNAQPAGKRITKMTLMSGGEKSLCALALLFAIYRTRSAPFYILDEVEAALDDINLHRLVNFIDQLRESTQLIMITHQRRTMEMADVLFGVSMQADGVTKVISQKLPHASSEVTEDDS